MNDLVKLTIVDDKSDLSLVSGRELLPLIENMNNPIGIEIGVDEAVTSAYLLENVPNLVLHGIDPYKGYIDWNGNDLNQNEREFTFDKMKRRLEKFSDRFVLHRKTSNDAVNDFEDDSYDFIFIDGIHEYDQVTKDCNNYWSKIKKDGIFSGHDYKAVKEVGKAVDDFAAKIGATVNYLPEKDVWWWRKF